MKALIALFVEVNAQQIVTLMSDIAARLKKFRFVSYFNALIQIFDAEQVITLMSINNSFAARIEEPRFMEYFVALFEKLRAAQVVTLMSSSCAARQEDLMFTEFSLPCLRILVLSRSSFC